MVKSGPIAQQLIAVSDTVQECTAPGARVSGKQDVVHSVANDKGFCGSGTEFLEKRQQQPGVRFHELMRIPSDDFFEKSGDSQSAADGQVKSRVLFVMSTFP